jgi:hypothetical protein
MILLQANLSRKKLGVFLDSSMPLLAVDSALFLAGL